MVALSKLRVANLLSFGESAEVELAPLNILIGPNGSGKSNFIEVIGLLSNAPEDLAEPFRETGGVVEWIWKEGWIWNVESAGSIATIEARVNVPRRKGFRFPSKARSKSEADHPSYVALRYALSFRPSNYQLEVVDERIEEDFASASLYASTPRVFFAYENGRPMLSVGAKRQMLRPEEINPQKSVLSQRKDPDQYPELTELGRLFGSFRFYRDWEFGIDARAREASPADAPVDFLEESARNLALMLDRLLDRPDVKPELLRYVKAFYAGAESVNTAIVGGRVDLRVEESGRNISAARLSDGTLRWLALLTILLHPEPPPLVCLEEPELGLHPDAIRSLADLLINASKRMQLIVTTHSDALVDQFTETPESIIVCEKQQGSTVLKRLDKRQLSSWLERYSLGQLWRTGEIGGNRW
jgi:predicted ATPase